MNEFETRLLYPDGKTSLHYVAQAGFVLKSKKENQLKVTVSSWLIGSGRPGGAAHFSLGRFSHTKEMNGTFNTSVI